MDKTIEGVKNEIFKSSMSSESQSKRKRDPVEAENSELKKEMYELKRKVQELSAQNKLLSQRVKELETLTGKKPKKTWQDMLGM